MHFPGGDEDSDLITKSDELNQTFEDKESHFELPAPEGKGE